MSNPAANLGYLQDLAESPGWQVVCEALAAEINKSLIPTLATGTVDSIAIAAISRAATYAALDWVRNRMLAEIIAREKKALAE